MFLKYNIPTLLWATVILFLTLLPTASLPKVPAWELISFSTASHAFVFLVLAVLMFWGFIKQHAYSFLYQYAGFTTFVISVIFGSLIELLQMTMGLGRQGDVMDIISNTIGTVAGIFTYNLLRHYTPFRSYL